jgi:hypothetical protein
MDPPTDSLYNSMDRFHLPPAGRSDLDRWAEWLYFNFTDPASGTFGFLSFIAAGDIEAGKGRALPLLQIVRTGARHPERYQGDLPLALDDISTRSCDLRFGAEAGARFENGVWQLRLGWNSPSGAVRGALTVRPEPDLYYPPLLIQSDEALVSGYTVPALRAAVDGWIEAGGRRFELRGAPGYHDHNWGTWQNVHWDWGTVSSDTHALLYGRIEHPSLPPGRGAAGLVALLAQARQAGQRGGFLALFHPDSIAYEWRAAGEDLPGRPARLPTLLAMRAEMEGGDRLAVRAEIGDVVATAPRLGELPLVFLQMRGPFVVEAQVARRTIGFRASGFAESFAPSR